MMNHLELTSLLLDEDCIRHIAGMTTSQLEDALGQEFSTLKGYDQNNPHHDRDLLTHTLDVLDGVRSINQPAGDRLCVSLAALLHDIGKPATACPKQNRMVFYGHPLASRGIADRLLHVCGFSEGMISRVLFFICYHDAFISFRLPSEMTKASSPYLKAISEESVGRQLEAIRSESETKYGFRPTAHDAQLLLGLCIADASAQAEAIYLNGALADTRCRKLARLNRVMSLLPQPE